ncbi:hypothetical protein TREMEDRAFT_64192 [Tremella mesenterica DSM 1558]|uniref:uncharacterized protein n=1 Tax=Tremella mesenterica (strain ATCC 24925 / CBS 8224 / DSM 1558 / NBRC 9311 / NRRL Y-6157 / RJB 2259-6 / UBC 559-6) TaxID=578456 RepID=UPI0003F48F83|nr:uncharacterized protein TREMEDRAFT_64192 [Tremella mesenterica DSM 1558]EIW67599.1 hypothetical protein TREMEDRAFT_64192 [Tremella mesenterica DSM 1558]
MPVYDSKNETDEAADYPQHYPTTRDGHEADSSYQSEGQSALGFSMEEWLGAVQSVPTWGDPNNPEEDEETLTRIEEEDFEDFPAASSEKTLSSNSADDVEAFDDVKVEKTIPVISADTFDRSLNPRHDSYNEAKIASSSTVQWTPSDRRIRQLQVGMYEGKVQPSRQISTGMRASERDREDIERIGRGEGREREEKKREAPTLSLVIATDTDPIQKMLESAVASNLHPDKEGETSSDDKVSQWLTGVESAKREGGLYLPEIQPVKWPDDDPSASQMERADTSALPNSPSSSSPNDFPAVAFQDMLQALGQKYGKVPRTENSHSVGPNGHQTRRTQNPKQATTRTRSHRKPPKSDAPSARPMMTVSDPQTVVQMTSSTPAETTLDMDSLALLNHLMKDACETDISIGSWLAQCAESKPWNNPNSIHPKQPAQDDDSVKGIRMSTNHTRQDGESTRGTTSKRNQTVVSPSQTTFKLSRYGQQSRALDNQHNDHSHPPGKPSWWDTATPRVRGRKPEGTFWQGYQACRPSATRSAIWQNRGKYPLLPQVKADSDEWLELSEGNDPDVYVTSLKGPSDLGDLVATHFSTGGVTDPTAQKRDSIGGREPRPGDIVVGPFAVSVAPSRQNQHDPRLYREWSLYRGVEVVGVLVRPATRHDLITSRPVDSLNLPSIGQAVSTTKLASPEMEELPGEPSLRPVNFSDWPPLYTPDQK